MTLAEVLGTLGDAIDGLEEHGQALLLPLEALCDIEEPLVRAKAIESIQLIAHHFSDERLQLYVMPLVLRLAVAPWFTSRMSAALLFPLLFERPTLTNKADLLKYVPRVCPNFWLP